MAGVPDYVNDLNAMHESEKVLTGEQWNIYLSFLHKCQSWQSNPYIGTLKASLVSDYNVCRATSRQRAEAFLRTIGKWIE